MGNLNSSCFESKNEGKAKLVDNYGNVTLVQPSTAAEIMLKNPGFAVTSMKELRRSRRFRSMRADDVLLARKVYLLVPVDRVDSMMSSLQWAIISEFVRRSNYNEHMLGGRKTRGGCKIFAGIGQSTVVIGQRKRFNTWKPGLETILEDRVLVTN